MIKAKLSQGDARGALTWTEGQGLRVTGDDAIVSIISHAIRPETKPWYNGRRGPYLGFDPSSGLEVLDALRWIDRSLGVHVQVEEARVPELETPGVGYGGILDERSVDAVLEATGPGIAHRFDIDDEDDAEV